MRSFVKIKPSQNGKITLSFTDICISCLGHEFLTWQICLLMLFAKIKFSGKFSNLQYYTRLCRKIERHTETYMYRTKRNH